MKLTNESNVKCPWCGTAHTLGEIDKLTYDECKSRAMRRAFKSLTDISVWKKSINFFYKCPRCSMWCKANQLILLDDEGQQVEGLGGAPIIEYKKVEQ